MGFPPPSPPAVTLNVVHTKKAFDSSMSASLRNGVAILTPAVGDILLDAWIEIDTAFDGTTPKADIGTFFALNTGWFFNAGPKLIDLTVADVTLGFGYAGGGDPDYSLAGLSNPTQGAGTGNGRLVPGVFTMALPIYVVASQNAQKGGTAINSTQGSGVAHLLTLKP